MSNHPNNDWSGKAFGAPKPLLLTKSWRVKHGIRKPLVVDVNYAISSTLMGEDAINADGCVRGLPVYAGYYNGTFANLNSFRSAFPSAIILSITPNGVKGARCIDCEPGDATVAGAADFVAANLPLAGAGGRNDGGKPMVYCSAGDSQAVINAVAAMGINRGQWVLWSAHWIGQHICSPAACGYPQADGTQYASNNAYDSDEFYSYCFGAQPPPPPSEWPLRQGSAYKADVSTLQKNINKWVTALASIFGAVPQLAVDGNFGPITADAVHIAQTYFGDTGPVGTCSQVLFNELAAVPVSPWPLKQGSTGPLVVVLQSYLNKWKFASPVLVTDGSYGPKTATAVANAQAHFKNGAQSGTCDQALYANLAAAPPPPPAPPFAYEPVTWLTILGAGQHSVKFEFTANAQAHNPARFEVAIFRGDSLSSPVVPTYPRYIGFIATGLYEQQLGGLEPNNGYTLAVRPLSAAGTTGANFHNGGWALAHFQTAA